MPTFSYKGYDFEVDHTPTEQEFSQMSAYVDSLPPKEPKKDDSFNLPGPDLSDKFQQAGEGLTGVGEAAMGMLAGLPAQAVGGIYGLGTLLSGQGYEKAAKNIEDFQKWNFGAGAYVPSTEAGQQAMEKVGEAFQMPGNLVESGLEKAIGPKTAFAGKLLTDMAMNFVPIHAAKQAGTMAHPSMEFLKEGPKPAKPSVNISEAIAKQAPKVIESTSIPEQLQLFDQFEQRSPISKYQTEMAPDMWRVDENGIPIRADLSMEAQNLQNPLQRNLWGDEVNANFPRDPNKPLTMDGDIPGYERFSEPVRFSGDPEGQIPLTEAIDSMAPEARAAALEQTRLGQEMPATPALEAAKMQAEIAAASGDNFKGFNAKTRKQGGGVLVGNKKVSVEPTEDGFVAKVDGEEVGYLRSNLTPEQRAMLNETANVDIVKVADEFRGKGVGKALYDAWTKANEGKVAPSGKTSLSAWKVWKRDNPAAVDAFVTQEAQRIAQGADSQQVLSNITDPEVAQRVAARTALMKKQSGGIPLNWKKSNKNNKIDWAEREDSPSDISRKIRLGTLYERLRNVYDEGNSPREALTLLKESSNQSEAVLWRALEKDDFLGFDYPHQALEAIIEDPAAYDLSTPLKGAITRYVNSFDFKKQRGGVLFDWKKTDKIDNVSKVEALRKSLGNLIPTEMTPDAVIEHAKTLPDVQQNVVQKGANLFTKGGLYQAEKTNNPIVKFTVDKVLNADRLARADIRDYIHDGLAPAMRSLSKAEYIEVAKAIEAADLNQVPLTPEFLKSIGFNDKQISVIDTHRQTMDFSFDSINRAREAAGKPPIDKRTAYAAMLSMGDFRKLVYKVAEDGSKEVVGILGAKTRAGLNSLEKKLDGKGYTFGEERYMGGSSKTRGGSAVEAVMQALEHLSEQNPETKAFLDVLSQLKKDEAYQFLSANKHTKAKKGVFGMEGRKFWEDDYTNAKALMDAQLRYAETAIKWGHLSDASIDVRKVLSSDVDMPNAKMWSEKYFQNALGINPSEIGRNAEAMAHSVYNGLGVGASIPRAVQQYSRKGVNTLLLGLNPGFLATNIVQPIISFPGMAEFLKSRGVDALTTGYDSLAKGWITAMKEHVGGMNALEKAAQEYAIKNHVYGSDLVDTSTLSRKSGEYYFDKVANFAASNIESGTRKMVYYGFVHMLNDNGLGKDFGLAQNLTDMAMNNYSTVERPQVYNVLGPIGDLSANLSSYKHNEISRLALFAREIGKEKNMKPFLVQLAATVAAAGIQGTIGFEEANWLYKQVTEAYGKPDSLSRVVLEFSEKTSPTHPYALSHGLFSEMGIDVSKRLGISDAIPNSLGEAMFPGGGKLVDVAKAGLSTIADPTEMNAKRLVREVAPGALTGVLDRNWFSKQTPAGEIGLNRRTLEPQVLRNDADKMAKNFGFTGIHESVAKQKLYELGQQNLAYSNMRTSVLKKMRDELQSKGAISPKLIEKYGEYEGDMKTLQNELTTMIKNGSIDAITAAKIQAAKAKTVPQVMNAQRVFQAFPAGQ